MTTGLIICGALAREVFALVEIYAWDAKVIEEASRQFAGNEWVAALLAAMKEIAESRSRERMMKESMYSASKLRSRLSAKDEDVSFSVASESIERPPYLRRKPSQGKGDV